MTNDHLITLFLNIFARRYNVAYLSTFFFTVLTRDCSWTSVAWWFTTHPSRHSTSRPDVATNPVILIPCHIHGKHWVALVRRVINRHVYFLYSDDLNRAPTETHSRQFLQQTADPLFFPSDATWIHCKSQTFCPHSNECGPTVMLALAIMGLHPDPNKHILQPYMHTKLEQIARTWVAYTLQNSLTDTLLPSLIITDNHPLQPVTSQSIPSSLINWTTTTQNHSPQQQPYKSTQETLAPLMTPRQKHLSPQHQTLAPPYLAKPPHNKHTLRAHQPPAPCQIHSQPLLPTHSFTPSVPTDTTLPSAIKKHSRWTNRIKGKPTIPILWKMISTQPTLYDNSFFKLHQTSSDSNPSEWGHVMETIDPNKTLQILLQNPNGICPQVTQSEFFFRLQVCTSPKQTQIGNIQCSFNKLETVSSKRGNILFFSRLTPKKSLLAPTNLEGL
jgi:hypothetical protein